MSQKTEIRDGMKIDWNVPITMDDGIVLRADVYRPVEDGHYPVILTYGVYAKGLSYQEGYPMQWEKMVERPSGDPPGLDQQVPELGGHRPRAMGPARVRGDARGFPGRRLVARASWIRNCPREIDDLYQCIEWAGTQPWSNGKVGMLGISYYASNQWRVAAKHPPHLAAIIPWEGLTTTTATPAYHGGILCEFMKRWATHPGGQRAVRAGGAGQEEPQHRRVVAGPVTLSDEELAKNRVNPYLQSSRSIRSTTSGTARARPTSPR